jgi:hypothetical protein
MVEGHSHDFNPGNAESGALFQLPPPPAELTRRFSYEPHALSDSAPHIGRIALEKLTPVDHQRLTAAYDTYRQLLQAYPLSDALAGKTLAAETVIRLGVGVENHQAAGEFDLDDVYVVTEAMLSEFLDAHAASATEAARRGGFADAAHRVMLDQTITYHQTLLRTVGGAVEVGHGVPQLREDVRYYHEEAPSPEQRQAARALLEQLATEVTTDAEAPQPLAADAVGEAYRRYLDGQLDPAVDHEPIKLLHVLGAARRQRMELQLQSDKTPTPDLARAIATNKAVRAGIDDAFSRSPKP